MSLSARLRRVLPSHTAATWEAVATVVPASAYLIGGTCLAARAGHRQSHDLDFCLEERVDLGALREALATTGDVAVDTVTDEPLQTLNVFVSPRASSGGATRVQFLDATRMRLLEPTTELDGLRLAGFQDLMATKLRAIVGRSALRDYFDLMVIETEARLRVEAGLALYVERYRPSDPAQALRFVVNALTSFDDLDSDPALVDLRSGREVGVTDIASYWRARTREIVAHLDRQEG